MSSAHLQLFWPEFLSCHCANHCRPMDLVPEVVRWFVESIARKAVPARILESEREARVNNIFLQSSVTVAMWQLHIEAGEPQLPPCSLCGLPTGSFCEGCDRARNPLCTICKRAGDNRCRLCNDPEEVHPLGAPLRSTLLRRRDGTAITSSDGE